MVENNAPVVFSKNGCKKRIVMNNKKISVKTFVAAFVMVMFCGSGCIHALKQGPMKKNGPSAIQCICYRAIVFAGDLISRFLPKDDEIEKELDERFEYMVKNYKGPAEKIVGKSKK